MSKTERYTLTANGLACRQDGEFVRAVEFDRVSLELHRDRQERDRLVRAANSERDSAKRAEAKWRAECVSLRSGEAATLKDAVLELLMELQWHYEPYDNHYHRDSGHYCPECGEEKDDGHDGGCALFLAIQLLGKEGAA